MRVDQQSRCARHLLALLGEICSPYVGDTTFRARLELERRTRAQLFAPPRVVHPDAPTRPD